MSQFLESCRALRVQVGDVRVTRAFGKVFVNFNYVVPEGSSFDAAPRSLGLGVTSRSRAEL